MEAIILAFGGLNAKMCLSSCVWFSSSKKVKSMKKKIAAITVLVMVALLCEAGCIGTNIGNRHQAKRKL